MNGYRINFSAPGEPDGDVDGFSGIQHPAGGYFRRSDIRQYKSLEEDAKRTEERIGRLGEISSINREYEKEKEKYL